MENPQFQRLNSMGETVGKPTPKPMSRIGANNQQQVGVLYGHDGSGKVYNYLGGKNLRVGDVVTPDVTHPKSGKTYRTLGKIVTTRNATGDPAQNTAGELSGRGIMMKTIGPTDQRSLPGYYEGWDKDAKAQKDLITEARLSGSPDAVKDTKSITQQARADAKRQYDTKMKRLNPLGEVK